MHRSLPLDTTTVATSERQVWSQTTIALALALALTLPVVAAWLLWLAPIPGITGDRTAIAARDFTLFWTAGHLAAEHALTTLYDPVALTQSMRDHFGQSAPPQIWPYPPATLLLTIPFTFLPLGLAFAVYTLAGPLLLWFALRAGGLSLAARVCVVLSPAIAENALIGQNGALTAAALAGGLLLIDRRPIVSGLMLGVLICKPQFGLLLPICLIAGQYWRTLLAMAATSLVIVLVSCLVYGLEAWTIYIHNAQPAITAYLEAPWTGAGAQRLFASGFMAMRASGANLTAAYSVQTALTLTCAALLWRVWRTSRPKNIRCIAITLIAVALASPWVHSYDTPIVAIAVTMMFSVMAAPTRLIAAICWLWPGALSLVELPVTLPVLSLALLLLVVTNRALAISPWPRKNRVPWSRPRFSG